MTVNPRWIGAGLVALSALSFGAMAIFARFAFAGGVDVTALLFLRFLIAGALMAGVMIASRRPWPTRRNTLTLALMGGVGYVAQALCFFLALKHASAGLVALLLYLYPFLVTLLGLPGVLLPTLTVWRRNLGNIALFAGVLTVVFLIWARASMVIFAMFYTQEMPSLDGFLSQLLALENIDFLLVYVAVGAGFALFVFALSVVSIPLMLDRNQDAITSMLASLRALMLNPLPLLVWAALIVTLTLIGFLSFHIGLVVMMPVVGHATWHAYRELVEPLS